MSRTFDTNRSLPLLKRLVSSYFAPHKKRIVFAVICMIISAGMTSANAAILKPVMDEIFLKKNADLLPLIAFAVFAIAVVNGAAMYGQIVSLRFVGQRIISDMQNELFAHLLHSDIGMFHEQSSGKLISRFTNDIMMMRNAVANIITGLAKEMLSMVFLVGLMVYQSWQLSLIALLFFPFSILPIMRLGKRMRKVSKGTQEQMGLLTSQLDETFSGVRMVKAYNREEYEIERARGTTERLFDLFTKASRIQAGASPIMETLAGIVIAGVVYYGGWQVIQDNTTPGTFFSFIAALLLAYKPAKSLANINTTLQEGLAAAERFFIAIDAKPAIQNHANAKLLHIGEGNIHFNNVTFHYPNTQTGIHGLTLDVPAGKTVALVGHSGSGKSTLMNLILRFYEAQEGRITVDGQDVRDVTLHSLRASMALVSQETMLFDDTVRANIAYGRDGATEEEIVRAAIGAAADGFIRMMPQGYDTMIGSHGVKLSGGQRQRIAIARAMLKNAPILLLDEATSALDNTAERQVQEALQSLMKGRTTLVIAHRLSTIAQADVIYVLHHGQIVETGTHESLISAGGTYARLYHDQFEGQEE